MMKRNALWLAMLLVAVLALPSWSLPKSLIMTMEISSKQGNRPIKATAQLWYANQKFRAEITSNLNMSNQNTPVKINNKATFITDLKSKVAYMLDDSSKMAIKIDQSQVSQMTGNAQGPQTFTDPGSLTDPAKIQAEIKKHGGKVVGKTKMLGHPVTIYQMSNKVNMPTAQGGKAVPQNVTTKVWLADDVGMPLQVEANSDKMGQIMSMKTTKLQVNVPVNASMFSVPKGYQVRSLMDMYKQK